MAVPQDDPNDIDNTIEPLAEDNDTPFSPPTPPADDDDLDDTHQVTDTNDIQPEEVYEEGLAEAAETHEPNKGSAVLGYDPSKDQRKQQQ